MYFMLLGLADTSLLCVSSGIHGAASPTRCGFLSVAESMQACSDFRGR